MHPLNPFPANSIIGKGISINQTKTPPKPIPAYTQTVRVSGRGQSQFPFVSVMVRPASVACVGVLCVLGVEVGQNVLGVLWGLKKG